MAEKRGRKIEKPIAEGLKAIGVAPDKVANVIISHLHYDHCGNYDTFPNARFHLQDIEMAYATGRCMCHKHLRIPFEEEDVIAMVRKVFAGRVTFHDGAQQIAPGITVHKIGGHSKGLQCVRVKTKRGDVILASDTAHLYSHLNEGRVFPITYNVGEVLDGYDTMKRLAASPNHIVPGHDPLVLKYYPAAKAGPRRLDRAARRRSQGVLSRPECAARQREAAKSPFASVPQYALMTVSTVAAARSATLTMKTSRGNRPAGGRS